MDRHGSSLELKQGFLDDYRNSGIPYRLCKDALYHVAEDLRSEDRVKKRPSTRRSRKGGKYDVLVRPCITVVLESGSIHNPEHKLKVAAVTELSAAGKSVPQIVSTFSGMSGFDRRKTERQVKHAVKKGYRPFKCNTIMTLGGCLLEECPIFRRARKERV